MNQGPPDKFDSPLDEVLESLPQEEPPADLRDRCAAAVEEAAKARQAQARPSWETWRTVVAAAAALVFMIGIANLMLSERENERYTQCLAPGPSLGLEPAKVEEPMAAGQRVAEAGPPPPEAPPPPAAAEVEGPMPAAPPPPPKPGAAGGPGAPPAYPREHREKIRRMGGPVVVSPAEPEAAGSYSSYNGLEPTKPWRDTSGERQKVTRKEMEVEVDKVEEAYDRAASIINKADGYVANEEVEVREKGQSRAHLSARVPVDRLDGVIAQLRELGKVVKLVGESEDVTKRYRGEGSNIRGLGAREDDLVAQYEKETNRYRKRELYQQIMALRAENGGRKQNLNDLSEQTHLADLELTLTEKAGPGRFLWHTFKNAGEVGAWLGATAIFWVPILVVVLLFWRRKRPV